MLQIGETRPGPAAKAVPFEEAPIVVDNGSSTCRAGYATSASPSVVVRQVVHRYQPKGDPNGPVHWAIGDEVPVGSRVTTRTPFESNLLMNVGASERVLDLVFTKLGLEDDHVAIFFDFFFT